MENTEFTVLLAHARSGAQNEAHDTELVSVVRGKVFHFLVRKAQRPDADLVDDLTNSVIVKIYEKGASPGSYPWRLWLHFLIKTAWAEHCRLNFSSKDVSLDQLENLAPLREHCLPVPVAVNASLLEDDGFKILRKRALQRAPRGERGELWKWAMSMLLDNGKVLSTAMGAVRSGLSEDVARQTILEAVLCVRSIFEDVFDDVEDETTTPAAKRIVDKIF